MTAWLPLTKTIWLALFFGGGSFLFSDIDSERGALFWYGDETKA